MGWWNNLDWAATGAWVQGWAGFAGAGAVVYAANRGAATYQRWLAEKQTEKHLAVAERILALAYRIKRVMRSVRSPGSFAAEIGASEQRLREHYEGFDQLPDDQKRRLTTGQTALTRLADAKAEWTELIACLPFAKAYFGDDLEAQLDRLWQLQVTVSVAAQMYGSAHINDEFRQSTERDLWEGMYEAAELPDPINVGLAEVIAKLENRLLPLLRSDVHRPQDKPK